MAIVRWEPLKDLLAIQERMNKIFDDTLSRTQHTGDWTPPVDIFETDEEVIITAEIPGVDEKDLDIQVADGVLTMKGSKKLPIDRESDNFFRMERSYGRFTRSFAIPNTIDFESIKASVKDGLLKIRLSKRGEAQPTVIKVEKG